MKEPRWTTSGSKGTPPRSRPPTGRSPCTHRSPSKSSSSAATGFEHHLQQGVLFNRFCKLDIRRWDSDRVEFLMPYNDDLSAHVGVFHGGVICALIDTCGSGAIMAGHDFNKGSRLTTVSLAVQYLSVAPGEDALAIGRCSRRGRTLHFADVEVFGAASGKRLASGQVTANVAGERRGVPGVTLNGAVFD